MNQLSRRLCGCTAAALVLSTAACTRGADQPNRPTAQVASRDSTARDAAVDSRPAVVILGTSLTAGYGLESPDDAYPAVLQRMADSAGYAVRIVNAGLSGETSAGALRRVERFLVPPPFVVIVETGANDGLRALDPDSTAANLREIVKRINTGAPQARVVVAQMEAPSNLGPAYTRRFHDGYVRVARETGAVLMPFLLDGVVADPLLNQDDGIHPTKGGARRVAQNVWQTLRPLLAAPPRH